MTNIRVALRVRPLSQREIEGSYPVVISVENHSAFITDIRVPERPSADSRQRFRQFDFDHIFWFSASNDGHNAASASQLEVYKEMGPHLERAIMAGYNACLLAYGQSGSGKTHSMIGTREDPGIIPRLCHSLLDKLHAAYPSESDGKPRFRMEVSFLEIYREKVRDLLNPEKSLKLREHPQLGPHVQGLTRLEVTGEVSLLDLLWEGERRRATGNTNSNRRSSRSHAIWTLYLTVHPSNADCSNTNGPSSYLTDKTNDSRQSTESNSSSSGSFAERRNSNGKDETSKAVITNQVHLVDLAGSEKADCTTAKSLLAEGADINRSLVALGNVISALAEKAQYVPYRDSALTWLLKDSIGGNASTSIIITASPSSHCHAQTLNSLRFAQRARLVENTPKINLASANSSLYGPYGILSVMSAMELKKDISRLAKIIKTAQTNGGILRGLAPRGGLTRLIHAIEGIGQAEKEQLRLQRERACSEDTTASSLQSQGSSGTNDGASSSSSATLTAAKSLNDVMVQADVEKRSALHLLRRRKSRQSESALAGPSKSRAGTSSSSPTRSPQKIVGTEVFIPTSNSYKCLTWQQEETHPVPKPLSSSSNSSLLSIDDIDEGSSNTIQNSSTPQVHQLKYLLEVHYPVTSNLDHASRISERIHGSFTDENYQRKSELLPTEVPDSMEPPCPLVHRIPTLVNPRDVSEIIKEEQVEEVDHDLKRTIIQSKSVLVGHRAKEEKDYLFPTKCKHFASPITTLPLSPFISSDENEFDEPENIEMTTSCHTVHPDVSKRLERTLFEDNTYEDTCYFTAGDSVLSQIPTMVISSSSSSYESINMPDPVRPVNLIREFSKYSDEFMESQVEDFEIENEVFHDDFEPPIANICMVPGHPMDTAVPIEILVAEPLDDNPPIYNPINGVSDSKFRNYFAKELHQMERMGKQIKTLLQMTQRYNVVKPYLDEISNLQNSDHSNPDPKLDAHIDSCSGWNVDIELAKVHQEIHQLNKVLKTGVGASGMAQNSSQKANITSNKGAPVGKYNVASSSSTINNDAGVTSDSSVDVDRYYSGYAHTRHIPLLSGKSSSASINLNKGSSGSGDKIKNDLRKTANTVKRPVFPSQNHNNNTPAKGSKSQPLLSTSSSNNDSLTSTHALSSGGSYFTPNFHSTPLNKTQYQNRKIFGGDTTGGSDMEEEQLYGLRHHRLPPTTGPVSATPSVSNFTQHAPPTSTNSVHTFYRNMACPSASLNNVGRLLQYCPSNSNMSSISSNASMNYDSLNSYTDMGYPLNISHSEPKKLSSGRVGVGPPHLQGGRLPHTNLRGSESSTCFHPYNSRQNSFNSEEIKSHRQVYEGGSRDLNFRKFAYVTGGELSSDFSGSYSGFNHERNGSDSLDLCSCGDSNSKYSTDHIGSGGLPYGSSLDKSSSRSQFSAFGGSTTTEGSDYLSSRQSSSIYHHHQQQQPQQSYLAHNHSNGPTVTGLPPQYPHHSSSMYKSTRINRNDNF